MDPATIIQARKAYNQYVVDQQSRGEAPMPFEEWAKLNYGGQSRMRPVQDTAAG
jgi:hypothetical protein